MGPFLIKPLIKPSKAAILKYSINNNLLTLLIFQGLNPAKRGVHYMSKEIIRPHQFAKADAARLMEEAPVSFYPEQLQEISDLYAGILKR